MTSLRLLRLIKLLFSVALAVGYGLFVWRDHASVRAEAEKGLMEIARLMEEHTRAALLAGSLQLSRIADRIGERPLADLAESREDWESIKRLIAEIPNSDSVWIADENGQLALTTFKPGRVRLDVSDRAYFTAARDGAREYVSPMIWGKVYGGYYFAMSRRLEYPDGRFRGVVQVSLRTEYFTDFYRTLRPEDGATFSIFRVEGDQVARYPLPPPGTEKFAPPTELLDGYVKADSGSFVTNSRFDGIERLFVYRQVAGQPLIVVTGLPNKVIFAAWRERALNTGLFAAAVLAGVMLTLRQLSQSLAREAGERAHAQALLADKQVLFQEIHHRVKNNLQIVSSFLTMQALRADPATARAFDEALSRIRSMGLVHQTLYEQHEASEVSMGDYLRALAASVGDSHGAAERGIAVRVDTDGTRLPLDQAVPLALLANEALNNALKHAFPEGGGGHIHIGLHREGDTIRFAVEDDGIGLGSGAKSTAGSGLGLPILKALAKQLDGELDFTRRQRGTRVGILFKA
ncbi:sensor histidine kinase [Magnetospirillum sp. UT-4]|uniref:sensor histidine kinase n=1 Tax=Magnetospirillum sp. UT-4 TaxID=2681467 RepID=UPI001381DDAF|nr:histidine kinase dimerization/phosphoacceptor domain -containing protein [Magnetospirillum sp. UT-4]CAA7625095.1 putative Signal transduction histidine kinase [Magnetospirillum sp. UT-4]